MEKKPASAEICKEEFNSQEQERYERFLEEVVKLIEKRVEKKLRET